MADQIAGSDLEQRSAATLARRAEGRMPGVTRSPAKGVWVKSPSRVRAERRRRETTSSRSDGGPGGVRGAVMPRVELRFRVIPLSPPIRLIL